MNDKFRFRFGQCIKKYVLLGITIFVHKTIDCVFHGSSIMSYTKFFVPSASVFTFEVVWMIFKFWMDISKVSCITTLKCLKKNFVKSELMNVGRHSVESFGFFCHSDFTWNQFLRSYNSQCGKVFKNTITVFTEKKSIFFRQINLFLRKLLKSWFHGNFWAWYVWSLSIVLFHIVELLESLKLISRKI